MSRVRRSRASASPVWSLASLAAHAGTARGGPLGPQGERSHGLPLFQTSNFAYPDARAAEAAAAGGAFLYTRHGNPTLEALEDAVAAMEGADAALAFASGMAAVAAAVMALGKGGEILASEGIYGGSSELLGRMLPDYGMTARFVPAWDTDAVAAALGPKTRVLLVETLTNPLLRVPDLPALSRLTRRHGVALIVDATFTSPVLCRPLAQGADLVVQSVSKYLGGHGDLIGGVAAGARSVVETLHRQRLLLGAVMDPFAAWLTVRGVRTLPVRMERQCATALFLARRLRRTRGVRAVHHPGLPTHPDHRRAKRLLRAPGAMISFDLGTAARARRFYDRVRLVSRAASLGEVSSLLTHPASFSHGSLSRGERARLGIGDGLLRLSVGLEDRRDLEEDIRQALGG